MQLPVTKTLVDVRVLEAVADAAIELASYAVNR